MNNYTVEYDDGMYIITNEDTKEVSSFSIDNEN